MSTIIELIITFVLYFLVCLAAVLPIAIFHTRQIEKLIDNFFHEVNESCAARLQSLKEVHAQVDEIHKPIDKMNESLDKMDESMDRTIEFKRLMRDYSNLKIKRIEARENFCESQFWDEKNIH